MPATEPPLYTTIASPIGELLLLGDGEHLCGLYLQAGRRPARIAAGWEREPDAFAAPSAQLSEYFAGCRTSFDLRLRLTGTPFQIEVWEALRGIGYGATLSYGELADRIGRPAASRAVGAANGANPLSIIVPCHRLIGSSGSLTGYAGGIDNKRHLLDLEATNVGQFEGADAQRSSSTRSATESTIREGR